MQPSNFNNEIHILIDKTLTVISDIFSYAIQFFLAKASNKIESLMTLTRKRTYIISAYILIKSYRASIIFIIELSIKTEQVLRKDCNNGKPIYIYIYI